MVRMIDTTISARRKRERFLIYLLTFVMGACGIAYEYTLSKISSDLLGNSVRQWAVIIGLMMFFMGVGSDLQKYIRDEAILDRFIAIELIQGLVGGFGPIILFYIFGAARDYFKVFQYLFIISIGLIIGLEIPMLTRINERYTTELRINLGGILRSDYIGAFLGAVLWIYLLLETFSLIRIGFVLGMANILVSGLIFVYFKRFSQRKLLWSLLLFIALLSLIGGFVMSPEWTFYAEQQLFYDRIVYSKTTKYQHIVITETASKDIYCYINGNLQFSSIDEHIYHEMLVHPAMLIAPRRAKVLVLGGGDGLAVREILKYASVETVTLVDIDPEMTDIAKNQPLLNRLNGHSLWDGRLMIVENNALIEAGREKVMLGDRTKFKSTTRIPAATVLTINIDAMKFVEQVSGLYDVIILDFPDPNNLELSKLYSASFYHRIVNKLARGGIVVQQSTSPVHSKEAFLCVGRTMKASGLMVVPFHQNVPTFGEWGWWIGGRAIDYRAQDIEAKLRAIDSIDVPTRHLNPQTVSASLAFGRGMLATEETTLNTLMSPAVYGYYSRALKRGF
jgi:spermidine synthase